MYVRWLGLSEKTGRSVEAFTHFGFLDLPLARDPKINQEGICIADSFFP